MNNGREDDGFDQFLRSIGEGDRVSLLDNLEAIADDIYLGASSYSQKLPKRMMEEIRQIETESAIRQAARQQKPPLMSDIFASRELFSQRTPIPAAIKKQVWREEYDPIVQGIVKEVEKRLSGYNQTITPKYKHDVLTRMAQIMGHNQNLRTPIVICSRPGLGKTEAMIGTLIHRLRNEPNFSAVVVTNFVSEAVRIRNEVNQETGKDDCFVNPSFRLMIYDEATGGDKSCPAGKKRGDYNHYLCSNCTKNHREINCPVKTASQDRQSHRVLIITMVRLQLSIDEKSISSLLRYSTPSGDLRLREYLFIDENPRFIAMVDILFNDLMTFKHHLCNKGFARNHIDEFHDAFDLLFRSMGLTGDSIEMKAAPDPSFSFSTGFRRAFKSNPLQIGEDALGGVTFKSQGDFLDWMETLIRNGFLESKPGDANQNRIISSYYRYIPKEKIRTVILDGSADTDKTYREKDFNIAVIDEPRSFDKMTIHHCQKSLSRTQLGQKPHLLANVLDVIDNTITPGRKVFVATYKDYFNIVQNRFDPKPNVTVDYFGNLRGKNTYRDCTEVFFMGINDYGHEAYFGQYYAISDAPFQTDTNQQKILDPDVNDFMMRSKAVELYQDLMRSKARNLVLIDDIDVYLFVREQEVIDHLKLMLPGVNIERWFVNLTSGETYAFLEGFRDNPTARPKHRIKSLITHIRKQQPNWQPKNDDHIRDILKAAFSDDTKIKKRIKRFMEQFKGAL